MSSYREFCKSNEKNMKSFFKKKTSRSIGQLLWLVCSQLLSLGWKKREGKATKCRLDLRGEVERRWREGYIVLFDPSERNQRNGAYDACSIILRGRLHTLSSTKNDWSTRVQGPWETTRFDICCKRLALSKCEFLSWSALEIIGDTQGVISAF